MNQVFGKAIMDISMDTENKTETMALLEANYKMSNLVGWELVVIDCKGNRHKVNVHNLEIDSLDEFIEM